MPSHQAVIEARRLQRKHLKTAVNLSKKDSFATDSDVNIDIREQEDNVNEVRFMIQQETTNLNSERQ